MTLALALARFCGHAPHRGLPSAKENTAVCSSGLRDRLCYIPVPEVRETTEGRVQESTC